MTLNNLLQNGRLKIVISLGDAFMTLVSCFQGVNKDTTLVIKGRVSKRVLQENKAL